MDLLPLIRSARAPEDLEGEGCRVWKRGDRIEGDAPIRDIAIIQDNDDPRSGFVVFFLRDGSRSSVPIAFPAEKPAVQIVDVDGGGPWLRSENPRLKDCVFVDEASRETMEEIDAIAAAGFDESQRPAGYYRPQVGDRVRFTNDAISRLARCVYGRGDVHELTKTHTIVAVGDELCPGLWAIDLSGEFVSKLLLSSDMVKKV